jgi:hypothetical protein
VELNKTNEIENLATEIINCSEVGVALHQTSHPCHQVVDWQSKKWGTKIVKIEGSQMHRPEAWTGDLAVAPILFLSSNPSFNAAEHFPNWNNEQWNISSTLDFALNRFTMNASRIYGASQWGDLKNFDRTIEKNGNLSKKRVRYWSWARKLVSYILDKPENQVSAISDYVMTEIVHCKSEYEMGVISARQKCKDKYLERILKNSPASLIFVVGKNAALDMKSIFQNEIPVHWSEVSGGFWPKTKRDFSSILKRGLWGEDQQKKHSIELIIGGKMRTVVYFAKPGGGGGLNAPWIHNHLVHINQIAHWRKVIERGQTKYE